MRTSKVRITTPSGRLVAGGVRASVEGLDYHSILAADRGEARPTPGRIPWEETVRVDKPSNHAVTGAIVSGVILGLAYWAIAADDSGNDPGAGTIVLGIVPVLGIGIGALIPAWHPIYRKHAPAD